MRDYLSEQRDKEWKRRDEEARKRRQSEADRSFLIDDVPIASVWPSDDTPSHTSHDTDSGSGFSGGGGDFGGGGASSDFGGDVGGGGD